MRASLLLLRPLRTTAPGLLRKSLPHRLFTTTIPRRDGLKPDAPIAPGAAPGKTPVEKPFYITTPIFYVNAAPHVGHLYTMVLTDVIKRWQVLKGRRALMCTGTDEHGMKIQQAAAAAETDPKEFTNKGADMFKRMAKESNTGYDTFIRTTDPAHHDAVQYFWHLLQERGYIYTGKHEGWYSVSDETFYPETSTRQTLCPTTGHKIRVSIETGRTVEWTSETNYHFRLSAMAPRLLEFYKQNPNWIIPATRYQDVINEVSSGITDLSISRPRDRLNWGIQVPSDPTQTIYVWLDALINYLTASGYPWTPGREHELGWPADCQVIGKDIVKFHCIYYPAFLLALDLPMPKNILTHAHWTLGKRKMSKTEGNVVNPFFALERFGVDTMRYYMVRDGGIQNDGDYSNEWIVERYKKDLQSGFGNLANRVCGVAFDIAGAVADSAAGVHRGEWVFDEHDQEIIKLLETTAQECDQKMDYYDAPGMLRSVNALMQQANRYITEVKPWALKGEEHKAKQNRRIFLGAEAVRVCSILLQPVCPGKAKELLDQMKVSEERRGFEWAGFAKDDAYGVGSNRKGWMTFPALAG